MSDSSWLTSNIKPKDERSLGEDLVEKVQLIEIPIMSGAFEAKELKRISLELNNLSFKTQQLNDQRNLLIILQEFKGGTNYGQREGTVNSEQAKIDLIDEELRQLSEKKKELQECQQKIDPAQANRKDTDSTCQTAVDGNIYGPQVFFIEAPPSIPAPKVILDLKELPPFPSHTQCPECRQFITTETVTSIGNTACLVCVMIAMIGCVAGCCFIPYCISNYKDVVHKCPKCRSAIHTVKKF